MIIGGNGWHTPDQGLNDLIVRLLEVSDVYHVTLDPPLSEIQRRVDERVGNDFSDPLLADHVRWMRDRYRGWTCRVDNTNLSPEATVSQIATRVARGEGRIISPLPPLGAEA